MNVVKNPEEPEEPGEPGEPSNNVCIICQDKYTRDNPDHLLFCGHRFHESCINNWFKLNPTNLTCPMCRATNLTFYRNYSKDFDSVIKDLEAQLQDAEQNYFKDSASIENGTKLQAHNPLNFKHYKKLLTTDLIEFYRIMKGTEPYHIQLIKRLEAYEKKRNTREREESGPPQHNSGAASSSSSFGSLRQSFNSLMTPSESQRTESNRGAASSSTSSETQRQSKRSKTEDEVDKVMRQLLRKDPKKGGTKLKKSRKHKKSKKRRKHKKYNKSRKY
jgi:hypothetical protein